VTTDGRVCSSTELPTASWNEFTMRCRFTEALEAVDYAAALDGILERVKR
jgi:hypothetical protein